MGKHLWQDVWAQAPKGAHTRPGGQRNQRQKARRGLSQTAESPLSTMEMASKQTRHEPGQALGLNPSPGHITGVPSDCVSQVQKGREHQAQGRVLSGVHNKHI